MAKIIKVSDYGEDTTLDDAPKRKMCWKCAKYNPPGAKYCAFCNAEFASDDDRYQTDGRTLASIDDKAYLSTPPPKVKKGHGRWIIALIIVVIVGAAAIVMIYNNMPDATFNYELADSQQISDTSVRVTYVINIRNDKVSGACCGNFVPVLFLGGSPHFPSGTEDDYPEPFDKGMLWMWQVKLTTTYKDLAQGVHIEWYNMADMREFHIERDPNMPVIWV